jgi:hypothetical protein
MGSGQYPHLAYSAAFFGSDRISEHTASILRTYDQCHVPIGEPTELMNRAEALARLIAGHENAKRPLGTSTVR